MITEAEVNAIQNSDLANGHLTDVQQRLVLSLFRQSPSYDAVTYPDVIERLARISGLGAKIMLCALRKCARLGASTTKITGGKDALDFDTERDREGLVVYMLCQLYDKSPTFGIMTIPVVGQTAAPDGYEIFSGSSDDDLPWQ
jgi:hypothetical protein